MERRHFKAPHNYLHTGLLSSLRRTRFMSPLTIADFVPYTSFSLSLCTCRQTVPPTNHTRFPTDRRCTCETPYLFGIELRET